VSSKSLTICTIFRDEEEFLEEFLDCCIPYADQLVLVDTGSRDSSLDLLRKRGVQWESFPWAGDFSKAKNYALSRATGAWVLFLDADERLLPEDFSLLKELLPNLREEGFLLQVLSTRTRDWRTKERKLQSVQNHLRLFRNFRGYQYRYKIHEVIVESIEEVGGATRDLEGIPIYHLGYCDDLMQTKVDRNIPLIEKDYQQDPTDPRNILYYAYSIMGPDPTVLTHLKEGWSQSHKGFALELTQAILEWFLDFGVPVTEDLSLWESRMLSLQSPSAAVSIHRGRKAYEEEDIHTAQQHYAVARKHLNQFPHGKYHHEVLDRLIVLLAMDGDFDKSLGCIEEYIRFHGRTAGIYHLLLKVCYALGDYSRFGKEALNPPGDLSELEDRKKEELYSLAQNCPCAQEPNFLDRLHAILAGESQ
jgi:tetratricopeptide (TPR) repeat protein